MLDQHTNINRALNTLYYPCTKTTSLEHLGTNLCRRSVYLNTTLYIKILKIKNLLIRIQNFYKDTQSAIKCILDFIVNALLINENKTIIYGQKVSKLTTSQLSTISIVFDMFIKKAHSLTIFIYIHFYCTSNCDKYKQFH